MNRQSLIWTFLVLSGAVAGSGLTMAITALTYIVLERFPDIDRKYMLFGAAVTFAAIGIAYITVGVIKDNHKEATTSEDSFPGLGSLGEK